MLTGCGGNARYVVERTAPATAATQPPEAETANEKPSSPEAQASSAQSITTPPQFPPGYRTRLAIEFALDYLRFGEGQPEISDLHTGNTLLLGSRTSVCVQFKVRQGSPRFDYTTHYEVYGLRDVLTLGQTLFKRSRRGEAGKCKFDTKPFRTRTRRSGSEELFRPR